MVHNEQKDNVTPIKKTKKVVYVKINCNTSNTTGPWSLGLPDVVSVDNVYVGNQSYSDSNSDNKNNYNLEKNSFETHYGLSCC